MYKIILLPFIATSIAQIIKFFLKSNKLKFSAKNMMAYSGMPSGHTAMVVSLATIIGLQEGLNSVAFGLSFIFAFLIIRDAIGLRQFLGVHGKVLNILVKDLKDDKLLDKNYPRLIERIGHTPAQVMVGGIIGFAISALGYYFF